MGQDDPENEGETEYSLYAMGSRTNPLIVDITIDGIQLPMEIDTGASVSVISEKTFQQNWTEKELKASSVLLQTYTGHRLEVKGCIEVNVKYQSQENQLPLLVIAGEGPSLLGHNWVAYIKLDWSSLHKTFKVKVSSSW